MIFSKGYALEIEKLFPLYWLFLVGQLFFLCVDISLFLKTKTPLPVAVEFNFRGHLLFPSSMCSGKNLYSSHMVSRHECNL